MNGRFSTAKPSPPGEFPDDEQDTIDWWVHHARWGMLRQFFGNLPVEEGTTLEEMMERCVITVDDMKRYAADVEADEDERYQAEKVKISKAVQIKYLGTWHRTLDYTPLDPSLGPEIREVIERVTGINSTRANRTLCGRKYDDSWIFDMWEEVVKGDQRTLVCRKCKQISDEAFDGERHRYTTAQQMHRYQLRTSQASDAVMWWTLFWLALSAGCLIELLRSTK